MGRMAVGDRSLPTTATRLPRAGTFERARCPACGGTLGATLTSSPDRLCGRPGVFSVARCEMCGVGVTLPAVDHAQLASFYPATYGVHEMLPSGLLGLVSQVVQRVQSWQAMRGAPLE